MTCLPRRVYEYGEDLTMLDDDDATAPVERAALGAILAACPRCGDFDPRATNRDEWACAACGHRFSERAYFQRVPPPAVSQ